MRWFRERRTRQEELDEEMATHLALEVKQRVERGESPAEAQRAARRQFGSMALAAEATRAVWGWGWLESFLQDLKYAVRTIRKSPGFAAAAILTLSLGIGANTAMFSVIDAALLRPLPFEDSDRLVRVWATRNGVSIGGPSPLDMLDFSREAHSFEKILYYDHWRKNVSAIDGSKEPEEMVVGLVPGAYFEVLRMKPLMGRLFTEEENQLGRHYVAAVSESFWRTRLDASPGVLGRTLRINGETYKIVAVIPDRIPAWMDSTTQPVSIWTPFASDTAWTEAARAARGDLTIGRLKPGVSYEQARAEMSTLAAGLARDHPLDQGIGATVEPLAETRSGPVRPVLLMLAGAVGMVLAIACANLAGLLLARNSVRYREIAVRAALGAGRGRLVRQMLLEVLVLGLGGGVVGLVFSSVVAALVGRSASGASPFNTAGNPLRQFSTAGITGHVLLFAFAIAVVPVLLFGLAPAFTGTRFSLIDALRTGGRGGTASAGKQRFRRLLVIGEMALSLVLLVAAGLLTESIVRLQRLDPGFRPDHLLKAHLFIPPARYPNSTVLSQFCEELARRTRSLPGVVDASVTTIFPPSIRWSQMFTVDGHPPSRLADVPSARFGVIDERYLATMGIPLTMGRDFRESDTASAAPVAIVNEEFVRRYLPDENPLGRQFLFGPPPGLLSGVDELAMSARGRVTIVGVARNFRNAGMAAPPDPQILALFRQQPHVNFGFKEIVVRTAVEPASIAPALAQQLRSLDADIPLGEVRTMEGFLADQTSDTRLITVLLGMFAGLGMLLAVIGAFGVISYLVAQRTQELGVRMALGAQPGGILWLVLRQGLQMGAAGALLGIAGALLTRPFLARLLYGVSVTDPWTLAGASALLIAVAAAASAIPARRAMRIDPVQALRNE